VIGFAQVLLVVGVDQALGVFQSRTPPAQPPSLQTLGILILLVGLVLVPFEEWFFRGVVLQHLSRLTGRLFALILSSALFSIAHGTLTAFGARFAYGVVLGAVYLRTGSLWPSMVAHYATNATLLTFIATAR
jgi:membrane protease YdiL (CAAX protease family)